MMSVTKWILLMAPKDQIAMLNWKNIFPIYSFVAADFKILFTYLSLKIIRIMNPNYWFLNQNCYFVTCMKYHPEYMKVSYLNDL